MIAPIPMDRIEYLSNCLSDGPDNMAVQFWRRPSLYSSMLFVEHVTVSSRGGERRDQDVIEFSGDTRDKADQKMMDWIESNGAVEKPEE